MSRYCIGIDLGGTFIKFGLLDENRSPSQITQTPTPADRGGDGIVEAMADGVAELLETCGVGRGEVRGVGIGAPGPLSMSAGIIHAMPNIPGMDGYPLRDNVSEALSLPAALENDANAAALGEFTSGAGAEAEILVLLTLGTGVGGGIVIRGQVLRGAHEIGAELGHLIIEPGGERCNCGQRGCLERYCSAMFLGKVAESAVRKSDAETTLREVLKQKGRLDARDVNDARRAGDALAGQLWDDGARRLATGCVSIARIFDPDVICLAGGMTKAGDELLDPLRSHFRAMHWTMTDIKTDIVLSALGNDAGAIGAAAVAWQTFGD